MLETAKSILSRIECHGYTAYFVGGCVRDFLLKRKITDIDIATSAPKEALLEIFKEYNPNTYAISLGVIELKKPVKCQITTFRVEGEYLDYRRPSHIAFVHDMRQDALRRDFTINALYMDHDEHIYDFYGGQDHLLTKQLVCIGDPKTKMNEDALRVLRAIRFCVLYDLTIDASLDQAMVECASNLSQLKEDTINQETRKLYKQPLTQSQLEHLTQLSTRYQCRNLYKI